MYLLIGLAVGFLAFCIAEYVFKTRSRRIDWNELVQNYKSSFEANQSVLKELNRALDH